MRISDWSSDVCSSDLKVELVHIQGNAALGIEQDGAWLVLLEEDLWRVLSHKQRAAIEHGHLTGLVDGHVNTMLDRKRVVSGKSATVRVDIGGRRIINKQKNR